MTAPDPHAWKPAADLSKAAFRDEIIAVTELFRASLRDGSPVVKDRSFVNCRLEGPAVLLALGGVSLDECDLGDAQDDIRSLLLRPVSPTRVTGCLPFGDCSFDGCSFFAVGFTGSETFIGQILALQPGLEAGA